MKQLVNKRKSTLNTEALQKNKNPSAIRLPLVLKESKPTEVS